MKKTLIALAVLAASGASFAQVTLTGNLTMGYQAKTTGGVNSSTDSAGFGVDTSEIDFMATEDLGGGMKATAKMALAGADRSNESATGTTPAAVRGRDASLALSSNVGTLTLATAKAADYLSGGIAGVGAYYAGFDSKVLSDRLSRDSVTFAVPVGAFTLAAAYEEAATGLGLGVGTAGAATFTDQSRASLSGTYSKGPIAANVTYLSYNARNNATFKDETRASGSYDFGVAKVGLGAVVTNSGLTAGGKATDLLLGVSAPLGAVTLGAQFVSRKIDDFAFTGQGTGTINGTAIEADYALSKRTSVIANYARWTAVNGNDASSQVQVLLAHSF
jgi:predicted porin